jgi:hypothetical protein
MYRAARDSHMSHIQACTSAVCWWWYTCTLEGVSDVVHYMVRMHTLVVQVVLQCALCMHSLLVH